MRMRSSVLSLALSGALISCSSSSEKPPELPACPQDQGTAALELRCTGLYSDWASKTVSADAIAYKPGVELWSDGSEKARWLSLPKGSKIDTTDPDEWVFPVGTKVWKEFKRGGKRIETRFYFKVSPTQWAWATYPWMENESKAERNDNGVPNADGNYEIPSTTKCEECHRGRKDKILGIEAIALAMPEASGLTLAKLKADGRLSTDVPAVTIPEDSTGKARAALAYLHMNCGAACHSSEPGAPASNSNLFIKLLVGQVAGGKVDALDIYKSAVGVKIQGNAYFEYESKGFLRIKPGVSKESLIPALAGLRDVSIQMPPIATHEADPVGRGAVEAWIDALPPAGK